MFSTDYWAPTPGLGKGLSIYISNTFLGAVMLLAWGPHFENHWGWSCPGLHNKVWEEDLSFLWPVALGPVLMFDPEQKPVSKNLDAECSGLSGWGYSAHDLLSLSPQNRSIQPEFQDRQTHASCIQRVGHQTSLALESSDIQPALQRGPQSPGPVPAPTTVPSALVRDTERVLGPS